MTYNELTMDDRFGEHHRQELTKEIDRIAEKLRELKISGSGGGASHAAEEKAVAEASTTKKHPALPPFKQEEIGHA